MTDNVIPLRPFACPACGGASYEPISFAGRGGPGAPTGVYRCTSCSYGFLNPSRYSPHQPR